MYAMAGFRKGQLDRASATTDLRLFAEKKYCKEKSDHVYSAAAKLGVELTYCFTNYIHLYSPSNGSNTHNQKRKENN